MISVHFHSLWLSTDHGITLLALGLVCLLTNKVKLTPYLLFRSATLLHFLKKLYCCWCALFSGKTLYDSGKCRGLLYNERSHTSQECCTEEEQVSWLLTGRPFFTNCRPKVGVEAVPNKGNTLQGFVEATPERDILSRSLLLAL